MRGREGGALILSILQRGLLAAEHAHTLRAVWRHRRADPETLRRFQVRKLRVLLAHCGTHVGAYREHWRGLELEPSDIIEPEDIEALPTIGKNDLRGRALGETLCDGAGVSRLARHMTSGSSGNPFAIYRSPREEHLLNFFRLRASAEAGLRALHRVARLNQLPLDEEPPGWPWRMRQALGIHREERFDGLAPANEIIENLLRQRPDVVCGYPSTLRHVAVQLAQREQRQLSVRLVLCGGEVLDPGARQTIENAFRAPVVDLYGAHEFNLLGSQCPEGDGYHVCDDNVLVEIVDERDRPVPVGEVGEVVATALHSYTMPFVRYRTGDLAIRGPSVCGCGAPFSALRAIQGRSVDYLRLPEGRRVHPYAITVHLAEREAAWVSQHQIVQADPLHVQLKIKPARKPKFEELERLRSLGAAILGPEVKFDLALVEHFPRHPSGKFQPYVSQIENSFSTTSFGVV
jgi:phenylacetate-CoA ligase